MGEDNTVAIVAIAVSGGTALAVAVISAITAHFRQRTSLGAESQRQVQQLAHDRRLRDLDETRTRLDDVIEEGESALHHVCEARLAFNAEQQQAYDDHMWQARDHLGQYGNKERRVRLRVGNDSPLIAALVKYRQAVQSLYNLVHESAARKDSVQVDPWDIAMAQVGIAQAEVIAAGQSQVGVRLD